jgi:hypothetical protein
MREAASLQEEQCNGQDHASIVENADVMPVLEGADGGSVQNTNIISDQGNAEHGSPRSRNGEDSKVQATSSDVGDDLVGALPGRWMVMNCQIAFRRKALNGRFLPKNSLPYNQRA